MHQLRHLDSTHVSGPFLIVAPLSLLNQWQNELATWSPDFNVVVLHGTGDARDIIVEHELFFQEPFTSKYDLERLNNHAKMLNKGNKGSNNQSHCKFNVMLTTYEMAMRDVKLLSKIKWRVLVVDEVK